MPSAAAFLYTDKKYRTWTATPAPQMDTTISCVRDVAGWVKSPSITHMISVPASSTIYDATRRIPEIINNRQ